MTIKELKKELNRFDENLQISFFIQHNMYNKNNDLIGSKCIDCNKIYINLDADGNEVYMFGFSDIFE